MGQTLTHGVYLPDEGERNCYDGLAGNWQLLDGAVGTVAEHTSQIAGKAPAVHTHTKADITDLLNSNFIPSANNSYDLGSFSYQWNNLYAKNYYYNGVAWGLDKANVWTGNNEFSYSLALSSSSVTYNQAPSSNVELPSIRIFGGGRYCGAFDYIWRSTGENVIRLSLGSYKSDGTFGYWSCNFGVPRDFSDGGKFGTPAFYPNNNKAYDLGTSTNKWKTLNGVNPGALSLPDNSAYIDITSSISDRTYGANSFVAAATGWISIGSFAMAIQIADDTTGMATTGLPGSDGYASIFLPVRAGDSIRVLINQTSTTFQSFRLLPCLGNV